MNRFYVEFKNCHGINQFKNNFGFQKSNINILYAPNGTMKTSFANTLKDLAVGVEPRNKVFKDLKPYHTVKIDEDVLTQEDIQKRVFVIDSITDDFNYSASAPLISNVEKRNQYAEILTEINDLKSKFLNKVKSLSKFKGYVSKLEVQILKDFNENIDFLDFLDELQIDEDIQDFSNFNYNDLFNDKVDKILKDEKVQEDLSEFRENLDNLIKSSEIFNEDFNHNNANSLVTAISKNNLFLADHSINFNSINDSIKDLESLEALFDSEIERIFKDDSVAVDNFKNINKKFKNQETKSFQNIIRENPQLIEKFTDINEFKKEYWMSIFKLLADDINLLVNQFDSKKETIKEIEKQAQEEETTWNKVVELFNSRFTVPFTLIIKNKEGVILKGNVPEIGFLYKQEDREAEVSLDELKEFCSRGQLRALYLLDVIYKIKTIEDVNDPKVVIMDDIADSFDYQNKYAIIEYINDLVKSNAFRIILLTHNYDFFRTVKTRFGDAPGLFAIKTPKMIRIDSKDIGNNIVSSFVKSIKNAINKDNEIECYKYFISTLPFIRNLYDFLANQDEKNELTYILHYKDEGKEKKIQDLAPICEKWGIPVPPYDKLVYDAIKETADVIASFEFDTQLNIQNKIVLSIAIRIEAEKYMLKKLGITSTSEINKDQTTVLYNDYLKEFPDDDHLDLFEKVHMMTPENIHVNSFMYEPILDMDDAFLKKLYREITELNSEI